MLLLLTLLPAAGAEARPLAAGSGAVHLLPLGVGAAAADLSPIVAGIAALYGLDVVVLPEVELPGEAYYRPRQRWRAEKIIGWLESNPVAPGLVLGLTAADISTTGPTPDWGVIGLARQGGNAGVVSGYRCARGSFDADHARERLVKVALHEIGHMLGLPHCPDHDCYMHDAAGRISQVDRGRDLCARCREVIGLGDGGDLAASAIGPEAGAPGSGRPDLLPPGSGGGL